MTQLPYARKHSFEKKADRWLPKDSKGPSDPRESGKKVRTGKGESFGEIHERAKKLGVAGRSRMDKKELARGIARKQ